MALAVGGTAVTAPPASAATTVTTQHTQGQFDNNPGNGAESWVWVWTNAPLGGGIEWQYYDGATDSLYTSNGTAQSLSPSKDIWRARAWHYISTEVGAVKKFGLWS
ncbi:hypothetical protein DP939_42560 [Spongiactinospora rosea]|uniref:Uncharacterized protein n=1 Tax=Spongiactinospora rosea TaxID=2248750 RepID=A0A366LLM3_9ACTN|nr:hypothetical protein DP939_42560 [Spongiactinospora rosea]